jgi:hypothetical protein
VSVFAVKFFEMELDFDKEIDALLRKARGSDPVFVVGSPHLEADEIAAFAENALPEKTRVFFTAHLAECDRCRKILTNTINFNTEAAPEAAVVSAPAVVTSAEPWYRKLFLFPNLAYAMGGLVLVFSAFLGYTVLRNPNGDLSSSVSQVAETESGPGGPRIGDEGFLAPSANSAANAANSAANTSANDLVVAANKPASPESALANSNAAATSVNERTDTFAKNAPAGADKEVLVDGVSAASGDTAGVPMTQPAPKAAKDDGTVGRMKREAASEEDRKSVMDSNVTDSRMANQLPLGGARGPSKKSAGPSRDMSTQFPNRAQNSQNSIEVAVTRNVSGKRFERKDGVWYDSAYHGQGTTNVRRGTDAYRKLDAVVRSAAENLGGTVVIVSGGRAYRIQ